jgi:hypothetical protein
MRGRNLTYDLFVMVDGIKKRTPFAYKKTPPAKRCVNYYQKKSKLHGAPISNCENTDLGNKCAKKDVYGCHIAVEWKGTSLAREQILDYVKSKNSP